MDDELVNRVASWIWDCWAVDPGSVPVSLPEVFRRGPEIPDDVVIQAAVKRAHEWLDEGYQP